MLFVCIIIGVIKNFLLISKSKKKLALFESESVEDIPQNQKKFLSGNYGHLVIV